MQTAADVLAELESLGTEQNRKVYRRHGVQNDLYGVSYASLNALKKKIKINHDIARDLWKSGNHDARVLATMIADPKQADESLLESWTHDLGNYVITDAVSSYIGQTRFTREKMEAWTKSDDEWIGTIGWNLLGHLAMKDQSLPDDFFLPYIEIIERTIHDRKNRIRHAIGLEAGIPAHRICGRKAQKCPKKIYSGGRSGRLGRTIRRRLSCLLHRGPRYASVTESDRNLIIGFPTFYSPVVRDI